LTVLLVAFLSFLFVYRQYFKDLSLLVPSAPSGAFGFRFAVAKVKPFFESANLFLSFFFRGPGRSAYLSKAGAKVAALPHPSKSFRMFFSGKSHLG